MTMLGDDAVAVEPIAFAGRGDDGASGSSLPFFDVLTTVLSQYANSPVILALLQDFSEWLDPAVRFNDFYNAIWDISAARGFGLDIWGRILGVTRILQVPSYVYLGFQQDPAAQPFDFGILYRGGRATNNAALTDEAYRLLLLAKAALNITNATIPAINRILLGLFADGHVRDNLDMTQTFVFSRALTPLETAIVFQSGVLPKPCGVSFTVEQP